MYNSTNLKATVNQEKSPFLTAKELSATKEVIKEGNDLRNNPFLKLIFKSLGKNMNNLNTRPKFT